MSIGKNIVDKVKLGGLLPVEIDIDPNIKNFLEQIANEQKVSWAAWIEEDAGVWHQGDTNLLPEDVVSIVKQLLGCPQSTDKLQITSRQFANMEKKREIPGIAPKINRFVDQNNVIRFYSELPELDYINNIVLNKDSEVYRLMQEKVLIPYFKILEKSNLLEGNNLPHNVPDSIKSAMISVFKFAGKNNSLEGLDLNAMVDYTLYNVLNLTNSVEMRQVLKVNSGDKISTYQKPNIFQKIMSRLGIDKKDPIQKEGIEASFESLIEKNGCSRRNLECILNGISAQIYMNTIDSKDNINAKAVEDRIQMAYRAYTEHEKGDKTFEVDDNGYRTVNVGIGGKDILLHIEGGNISRAMKQLSGEIADVMKQANTMKEEEYIKEVAKLHFRYIMVHPFRDSNGRIGRNIINMMLGEVGRNFVLTKNEKKQYIDAMEEMRSGICSEVGKENYLGALSRGNVDYLNRCEEKHCESLADIISKSNTIKPNTYTNNRNEELDKTPQFSMDSR